MHHYFQVVAPVLDQTSKGRKDNQCFQSPWPLAVSMELERQARNIRGTVNRARGLLDGKTVLYWPWTGAARYFKTISQAHIIVNKIRRNPPV